VQVEDGLVTAVQFEGGCQGNLAGLSRLVIGMPANEAADRLRGIRCGQKSSSCPDQLATAITQMYERTAV